ncbi:MAG TPA: dihydrodipicolinate synthase family protein [Polyangiaceae bacterium]|nr:dihydrodipicolinate synthase family protein [Polyangiaceae bacterium]
MQAPASSPTRSTTDVPFTGIMPAMTTPFHRDSTVDHPHLAEHCRWLLEHGASSLVPLGSLGEGATLGHDEKRAVLETCVRAAAVPIVAAIAGLATAEAVMLAKDAQRIGCRGLMVLPPYVYSTDWREMKAHVATVLGATELPCMLYNNPIAYKTDFAPHQIAELAREFPHLRAVKESSTDVRRVTALRAILGDRLEIAVGVDDAIVEGIDAGATGWVAGLVNAFPAETLLLFRHAAEGRKKEALALYRWFLPLLRMDTVTKFVQLIKLAQEKVGHGSSRVRPPRLALEGDELALALATIDHALETRPRVA